MSNKTGPKIEASKILIVDDSRANLMLLREILTSLDCQVVSASNGLLALSLVADDHN
jgi:CheY-like chemotaxis protein